MPALPQGARLPAPGTAVPPLDRPVGTDVPLPALERTGPGGWHGPCCGPGMDRLDNFFGVHATALKLRGSRISILASNIANAATPGYKARDLDFQRTLQASTPPALSVTRSTHLQPAGESAEPILRWRVPVQPSLDGNSVELATEQLQFTENALRYRSTLAMLNGRISSLMSALRIDG